MKFDKTAYCESPVTKLEKSVINKDGFKVVDIRFAPEKLEAGDKLVKKPKTKK